MTSADAVELDWSVVPLEQAMDDWRGVAGQMIAATPQDVDFVRSWQEKVNRDCIAVIAVGPQGPEFLLPLETLRLGPLRIARFPGGSHANANFAPLRTTLTSFGTHAVADAVKRALKAACPDIDLVHLERMLESLDGLANPLVLPTSRTSPNVALSFGLHPSFTEVLKARNGAKKQKKMRQMQRRMEERGGWRVYRAMTEAECHAVLQQFFKLKGERLKSMGLRDVFAEAQVQAFFENLFCGALGSSSPRFELHTLEIGGEVAAVAGCTIRGRHLTVEFGGICTSDRQLSPGDILYHLLIEDCCRRGFEIFDFGVGDEFYKRRWCDVETWHRDTLIPLSAKGRLAASAIRRIADAKRYVKNNPALFGMIKKLRGRNKMAEQD